MFAFVGLNLLFVGQRQSVGVSVVSVRRKGSVRVLSVCWAKSSPEGSEDEDQRSGLASLLPLALALMLALA